MSKYKQSELTDLRLSYKIAAQIVRLYGETYLPIFQRMHEEIEKESGTMQLKCLALKIADEYNI